MGLVDYSDSESDSENGQQKPTPTPSAAPKKPFQKLLDRSSGAGKILVNLPAASTTPDASAEDEQPPAKRAKTSGGSRFSSLGSFLPPPKKTAATAPAASARTSGTAPAPGVHLRTAAEPAFVRGGGNGNPDADGDATHSLSTPDAKGPSIPEGQKPEEEVKLVGKPLMFKPLSVARKKAPLKTKKKDTPSGDEESDVTSAYPIYQPAPTPTDQNQHDETFSSLADTLSPPGPARAVRPQRPQHQRRRPRRLPRLVGPAAPPGAKVITFDMEREYAHNEALRASGAQQAYNPLRQVVNMAQSNQGALEESFARAKSNQRDAAGANDTP
ncbi:hypothetical protein NEMBOFW57_000583 [Staphylotrichum longicolle]|uniref:Uncharacterized protein n=1 Tax=Staphylotrichum longicolle TaxID=669026 RepID=A0AAD4I1U3_9PEZI|nr:hypothetical protein NEMBOFW57_000583 [Staphylotrichum longicolle]